MGITVIARDMGTYPGWVISFETLEELLAFVDREGPVIIRRDSRRPEMFHIEIYDAYYDRY